MAAKTFIDLMAQGILGSLQHEAGVPYINTGDVALSFKSGSGSLASGAVTVQTGLRTISSFIAILSGATGFATGATEVSNLMVTQIITGSVKVQGIYNSFVTGAATLSISGTGGFIWEAIGTLPR